MKISTKILLLSALAALQCSCVVVGGYTSGGGWFLWPGSVGLLVIAAIVFLLFRRR